MKKLTTIAMVFKDLSETELIKIASLRFQAKDFSAQLVGNLAREELLKREERGELISDDRSATTTKRKSIILPATIEKCEDLIDNWINLIPDVHEKATLRLMRSKIKEVLEHIRKLKKQKEKHEVNRSTA